MGGTPLVVDLQCISVMKLKKICVERVYSGPGLVASKCPLCMLIVDRRVVEKSWRGWDKSWTKKFLFQFLWRFESFFFCVFFCVVFVVVSLMVVVLYINALISLYLFAVTWSMWNSCLWRGWENKPSYQRVFSFGYQYRLGVFFGWRSKFVEIARERSFMGWNGQDRLSGWVDYCACCCCWVCVSMMGKLDISFCSLSERIGIHVRRFLLV